MSNTVTTVEVIETLPAPLTSAEITERELRRLETFGGEVLADPSDAKAAKALDAKRIAVKNARTTTTRICKEQREDAIRVQKEWIAVEKSVVARLEPVEDHLESEVKRHAEWKAEQARIAEEAARAKTQARVDALTAIGAPVDMWAVGSLGDVEWSEHLAAATERARLAKEAAEEAARQEAEAQRLRDEEAARVAAEQAAKDAAERAEREAREAEEAARRAALEAENARLRAEAEAERVERERIAAQERAAAEAERARLEAEAEALRRQAREMQAREDARIAAEAEAARKAKEAEEAKARAEQQAREEEERKRIAAEREEALRPDREKMTAWACAVEASLPALPEIVDAEILAILRRARNTILSALEGIK